MSKGEYQGRSVVPSQLVRVAGETAHIPIPGTTPLAEPKVELIRAGELIQAIDVTCACGRKIRLRCIYQ
jgi:hypothetical protein